MRSDVLVVPGAKLYYEVRGAGPVLLLVCGGVYDAEAFAALAEAFADRYTVVTYDRRGNSRSPLDGGPVPQEIEVHADDARRVLEVVRPGERAEVFGNSSGAIIALELAARHPEVVRTVVAHEPPLFHLLPDHARWSALMDDVERTFQTDGPWPALEVFNAGFAEAAAGDQEAASDVAGKAAGAVEGEALGQAEGEAASGVAGETAGAVEGEAASEAASGGEVGDGLGPGSIAEPGAEVQARMQGNFGFFIGYEVPSFAKYRVDPGRLAGVRVVVGVGAVSGAEPPGRAAYALASELEQTATVFPGGHGGFGSEQAAFAAVLRDVLRGGE